ncbi:tetratricopeptide repeat protein [Paraburkholderia sp. J94]|uniref:tetratricopeptide repeat protein n=1 Tax=Paraburkholderia sp. J94 TaxID=2805441 RepID=UPI002AB1793F|nr:tetratricopeptide repeat protein [Paraburkholderia sp. J94]
MTPPDFPTFLDISKAGVDALADRHLEYGYKRYASHDLHAAEHAFRDALHIKDEWPPALNDLGLVLRDMGRFDEAEEYFLRATAALPSYNAARNNLAVLYWKTERIQEAEIEFRSIMESDSRNWLAATNLGLMLYERDAIAESESLFRQALIHNPGSADIAANIAAAMLRQHRVRESIPMLESALAIEREHLNANQHMASALLSLGDYARGFAHFEYRLRDRKPGSRGGPPAFPYPHWNGESLAGKSLLIWPEHGFGDIIQFCRYARVLKERGASRVDIACAPSQKRLFESLDGVDEVFALDGKGTISAHDYWCWIMSLPFNCHTTIETIPNHTPYLRAPRDRVGFWKSKIPSNELNVGIVWSGDPRPNEPHCHAVDKRRSMRLALFSSMLGIDNVNFFSLQKGESAEKQIYELPEEIRPLDVMRDVSDFAETAAIIECLDLVITVDTSVAHLAGALNKPVWILSRHDSCWRWLLERDDSPWYPSARIFRQREAGNWEELMERVHQALMELRNDSAAAR